MSDLGNVMGKWNYGATPQFPYGEDTTYQKAIEFLDGPYIIEDWGCGTAYARRFVKRGRYIGLDGSWSMHCERVVDLRTYRSTADAILMRHLIEHNYDWKKILENALASFQKKFVLVMFTPFSDVTHSIGSSFEGTVPDLSFQKQDLVDAFGGLPFSEESVPSATQYGYEHIFYFDRTPRHGDPLSPTKTDPVTGKRGHFGQSGTVGAARPKISIIIPTAFDKLETLLKPNLESMKTFTELDGVEVIVVANGCTDGTEDYVKSLGAPFRVLSFPEPLGYTKATNEGIKVAQGDYLVLLNNDIVFLSQPRNQWVEQLLAPFKDNPKMGITGPLQMHDYYAEQDMILGSCLCISRAALDAAGGWLDEIYSPGGGEDVDLCCKVRQAGYIVRQIPQEGKPNCQWTNIDGTFMIYHKNNQTFKDVPDYWEKIVRRNGLINMKRHNREIRLNLFGKSEWGYISVSDQSDLRAPVELDPKKLDLEDGTVAELLVLHPDEADIMYQEHILREWHRVLRPGGKIQIELPDRGTVRESLKYLLGRVGFGEIIFGPEIYPHPNPPNVHISAMKP